MPRTVSRRNQRIAKMRVGDVGILRLGKRRIRLRVIEDRGLIGKNGRQIVRVLRVRDRDDESQAFEMPAEELEISRPKKANPR